MPTRRDVILHGPIAAGFIAASMSGAAALAAGAPPVRRTLSGMAWNDPILATYRDGVRQMKGMKPTAKFSWTSIAKIHGTDPDHYHFCPHGDWYFLPWHRAYTVMCERIIRSLSGNNDFAMPYWDWTADPLMPAAFLSPTTPDGKPNALCVTEPGWQRTWPANTPMPPEIVGPDVLRRILSAQGYENFGTSRNPAQNDVNPKWVPAGGGHQGILEGTPHNNVHNNIGGWMPTASSPRDPLFYMHHSNIDRIWALWNLRNANSTNPLWTKMNFTRNFLNVDGSYWSPSVSDLYSPEALGYSYGHPAPSALESVRTSTLSDKLDARFSLRPEALTAPGVATVSVANTGVARPGQPLEVPIDVPAAALASVKRLDPLQSGLEMVDSSASQAHAESGTRVLAFIRDLEITEPSTTMFRVFVDAEAVSANTPVTDPHYVGTFAFLRHRSHEGHDRTPSIVVDLTEALQQLGESTTPGRIRLQIVPVSGGKSAPVGSARPSRIEVSFIKS